MKAIKPVSLREVDVELGAEVVVSMAAPEETMWGFWQFPTLSRLPGGELLLTVNNAPDDDLCYGHAAPAWLSHDDGRTWHAADLDEKQLTVAHSPVCELFDGEYLCLPMPLGLKPGDMPKEALGEPAGRFFAYCWRSFYPLDRFPRHVRDYFARIPGLRWNPKARRWDAVKVKWDTRGVLVRVDEAGMVGAVLSTTSLEYRPIRFGKELLDANYKLAYRYADGSTPKGFEVTCMASRDNGRSWQRRGLIAADPKGEVSPTESAICETTRGDLVTVTRTTDHRQSPMWVTHSRDAGRTWSRPQTLFDHGVLPTLQMLGNGVLVLSYGRPGVRLSFSPRGDGRTWTHPLEVLPTGIPAKSRAWKWERILNETWGSPTIQRDGYTSVLPVGEDRLLIAYCDMAYIDARGRRRKAVKVRTVTVRKR